MAEAKDEEAAADEQGGAQAVIPILGTMTFGKCPVEGVFGTQCTDVDTVKA